MKLCHVLSAATLAVVVGSASVSMGQTVAPEFAENYTVDSLGNIPGVPGSYGGVTFLNPNTLLLGGAANGPAGAIYSLPVNRDPEDGFRITGFGTPTVYASAPDIDGGLSFGPGGVLFYTGYNENLLYQIKPGSTAPDKVIQLNPLGIASSVGALAFVPTGQPGAGDLKLASYNASLFYSVGLAPDGNGTYDITTVGAAVAISGGPEGLIYVPAGSPLFPNAAMLVSEWGSGNVSAWDIDANNQPIPGTRRLLVSGLSGAEGAVIDPFTGDFLFSTFGGGDRIVRVTGFAAIPEPSAAVTLLAGLPLAMRRRR